LAIPPSTAKEMKMNEENKVKPIRLSRRQLLASSAVAAAGLLRLTAARSAAGLIGITGSSMSAQAQNSTETVTMVTGRDHLEIYPLPADIVVEKDVMLTMNDGTSIACNIYRPQTPGPHPVICAFTVYGKDLHPLYYAVRGRAEIFRAVGLDFGDLRVSDHTPFEAPDPGYWVPNGYIVIHVDGRGSGNSEGELNGAGPATIRDYADIITWASKQSWSTGHVAMVGVSYLAFVQWAVAALQPEGLAAMIPWEGFSDPYRDLMFHGGIPETGFVDWWMRGDQSNSAPGNDGPVNFNSSRRAPPIRAFPPRVDFSKITVPALICASWSAQGIHSRGCFVGYEEIASTEKWLYTHGRHEWTVSHSLEALDYQRAFLDRYLKMQADAMADVAPVHLETRLTREDYRSRKESAWPPSDTQFVPYHLDAASLSLSTEKPASDTEASYASTEGEALNFKITFERDTEITGPMALYLSAATDSGNEMDIFVGIRKFNAVGEEELFYNFLYRNEIASRGWLRASHRSLDAQRSQPGRPWLAFDEVRPVVPGERMDLAIEILPNSILFEAGSSLVLTVRGQDIVENRNSQHKELMNAGRHIIYTGGDKESYLLLPVQIENA
jgi:predicted acyl esterase